MESGQTGKITTSGSLADFKLTEILQALALGRHCFQVNILTDDLTDVGNIVLKADRILAATGPGVTGKPAFRALCQRPDEGRFQIAQLEPPVIFDPLGRLQGLLLELLPPDEPTPSPVLTHQTAPASAPCSRPVSTPLPSSMLSGHPQAKAALSIAVVSPKGGVGKTTIALNLANALAASRRRVVLIDGSVNGDILAALGAQHRPCAGVAEVLAGRASLEESLLPTANPTLKLLAAFGPGVPVPEELDNIGADRWCDLITQAHARAEIVLIDTPAGLFGATRSILSAVSHVLGVLQAEPLSTRLSDRFSRVIESLPAPRRPALVGLVVNMLQADCDVSVEALRELAQREKPSLFQSFLPRTTAFLAAAHHGQPVRFDGEHAIAGLFDAIAAELSKRLKLPDELGRYRFLT
jgi:chromosome partitioning protein